MKPLKIGRNPDNDIVLSRLSVSRYHVLFTPLTTNSGLLQDLESTYGTEVDGFRIAQTLVTRDSHIVLGQQTPLATTQLFAQPVQTIVEENKAKKVSMPPGKGSAVAGVGIVDVSHSFAHLAEVYKTYQEAKAALESRNKLKQMLLSASCGLIPYVGTAINRILAFKLLNEVDKLKALEEEMRVNYLCPNCAKILHATPYEVLVKQKKCLQCKAIWVR